MDGSNSGSLLGIRAREAEQNRGSSLRLAWPGPAPEGTVSRRILSALLLVASFLALLGPPGCSRPAKEALPPQPDQPRRGGTLRIANEAPSTLDPVLADDIYEGVIDNQIYEGLVRFDTELRVQPCLAASWVVSADGCTYRFTLRPGVRFHDGRPLNAEAVARSIERALDPERPGPCLAETYLRRLDGAREYQAGKAPAIRGVSAEGDDTVVLRLEEPLSFFLSVLCMNSLGIVPPLAPGELPNDHPIGTGPFRFVRRAADGSVILARNESYWGTPALLDSLDFVAATGASPSDMVARLMRGDVDVISLPAADRALVGEVAGYRILRSPEVSVSFLGINTSRPPLDRLEVRQAIAEAIDRARLIPPEGADREPAIGVIPPVLGGYSPTPKVLPYAPAQAQSLLAAAGYGRSRPLPPIDFYTSTSSAPFEADHLAAQLAEVGITIRTRRVSWPELDSRITRGQAPLFTLTWLADVPDPDSFLYFLFHTGESNNLFSFSDVPVDSLLALGRRLPPGPGRFEVYRQAESRVLSLVPMVPLYHETTAYAWDPAVEGIELNPFGFALTRFDRLWLRPGVASPGHVRGNPPGPSQSGAGQARTDAGEGAGR